MGNNHYINSQQIQQIKKTPFIVRLIFILLLITQLINWITNGLLFKYLSLNKNNTSTQYYQIWRNIFGWLCQPSLLTLLIVILTGWSLLTKFQYKNSSAVLLNDFIVNNYIISIFYFIIQLTLYLLFNIQSNCPFSIVAIWINFIYKCSYYNSHDKCKIYFTNCQISMIYYPFWIFLVVSLINYNIRFDAVFGLVLSIVECKFFNGGFALYTKDTYTRKQQYSNYLKITNLSCWQPLNSNKIQQNHRMTVSSSQFYQHLYEEQINEQLPNQQPIQSNNLSMSQAQNISIT